MGGHPSIVHLVAMITGEYVRELEPEQRSARGISNDTVWESYPPLVDIFQSRAYEQYLPAETSAICEAGLANIHWVESQNNERFDPSNLDKPQCEGSLSAMRERLLKSSKPIAMVGIGGMEGLRDEFKKFSRMCSGSVYLYRSTGGAAQLLADETKKSRADDSVRLDRAAHAALCSDDTLAVFDRKSLDRVRIVESLAERREDERQIKQDWVEEFRAFRDELLGRTKDGLAGFDYDSRLAAINPPYDFLANLMVAQIVADRGSRIPH